MARPQEAGNQSCRVSPRMITYCRRHHLASRSKVTIQARFRGPPGLWARPNPPRSNKASSLSSLCSPRLLVIIRFFFHARCSCCHRLRHALIKSLGRTPASRLLGSRCLGPTATWRRTTLRERRLWPGVGSPV